MSTSSLKRKHNADDSDASVAPTKKSRSITTLNSRFIAAIHSLDLKQAASLFVAGKVSSESKKLAIDFYLDSDQPEKLKFIVELFGNASSKRLLNNRFKTALDNDDDHTLRVMLDAVGLGYNKEWQRAVVKWHRVNMMVVLLNHKVDISIHDLNEMRLNAKNLIQLIEAGIEIEELEAVDWFPKAIDQGIATDYFGACQKRFGKLNHTYWAVYAIKADRLEFLSRLHEMGFSFEEDRVFSAATDGQTINLLAMEEGFGVDFGALKAIFAAAIDGDNVSALETLEGFGVDFRTLRAEFGNLVSKEKWNTVNWLLSRGFTPSRMAFIQMLYREKDEDTIRWALDNGGDPFAYGLDSWRNVVRSKDIRRIRLFNEQGVDLNRDKGFLGCYAAYMEESDLIKNFVKWNYVPVEAAADFAKAKSIKNALMKVRDALATKIVDVVDSTIPAHHPAVQRTAAFQHATDVSTDSLVTFINSPALSLVLSKLDTLSFYRFRSANRLLRHIIPYGQRLSLERLWDLVRLDTLPMDYGAIVRSKHRTGEIQLFDDIQLALRHSQWIPKPLYIIAAYWKDSELLELILRNLRRSDPLEIRLLVLIPMGGLLSVEKARVLLSPFRFPFGCNAIDLDAYFNAYSQSALEALKFLYPYVSFEEYAIAAAYVGNVEYLKALESKPHSGFRNALSIAAERGDLETVKALVEKERNGHEGRDGRVFEVERGVMSRVVDARVVDTRVVDAGHWEIVKLLLRNGFGMCW
ncbi:hypothetical protein BJ742DRAFT_837937 [Cladochytrium replicatum]|nr:hypothetical protein BJ742DRAFT_837937 [Cladochytrium replicatum]